MNGSSQAHPTSVSPEHRAKSWTIDLPEKEIDASSVAPNETETEIKYKRPLDAIWGLFSDYANNSSIHGVRYMGEMRRPWIERVWWAIAFLLSIYGCSRLIYNVWTKWDQSSVIVSTPVWQIPFPAVTICPETKTRTEAFNYTEMYHRLIEITDANVTNNINAEELWNYEAISQVCHAHLHAGFNVGNEIVEPDIVDTLKYLSPTLEEILFICKWRNTPDNCNELFSPILTEEGICYTFNALNSNDIFREENIHKDYKYLEHNNTADHWNMETGYSAEASLSPYPKRVLSGGARAGLFVLLPLYKYDFDYICRGPVQGFKVLLHTPGEIPLVSKQYFRVPLNEEVTVSVKPNMITASPGFKDYHPHRRQCFFNEERYLRFFKVYTQQNCELECLANFTMSQCGCVKFSMPRDDTTPVCGAKKIHCYNNAEDELLLRDFEEGLADSPLNHRGRTQCDCLPSCTSITYDAEGISQAEFHWEHLFKAYDIPLDEFPGVQFARLSIFFKENQFITSRRSEVYGPTDFLANCGGLLGLFMGVSFLSIVEIIYYLTIRLCCNLSTRKKRKATMILAVKPREEETKRVVGMELIPELRIDLEK